MSENDRKKTRPFSAEAVIFDANLQEFATKIGYICSLEQSGKISAPDAYDQIKKLYKQLKTSRKNLNIGRSDQTGHKSGPNDAAAEGDTDDRGEEAGRDDEPNA